MIITSQFGKFILTNKHIQKWYEKNIDMIREQYEDEPKNLSYDEWLEEYLLREFGEQFLTSLHPVGESLAVL